MGAYLSLLFNDKGSLILIIILFLIILGMVVSWSRIKLMFGKQSGANLDMNPKEVKCVQKGDVFEPEQESRLGKGAYRCMAYRNHPTWGPSVDFTTMPDPVGEIDIAESSCPSSGALFVVLETSDHSLLPYTEARRMPIVNNQTPEFAWICTHWNSAKRFWTVPKKWFQSTSNWFAIGLGCAAFIIAMITVGGGK